VCPRAQAEEFLQHTYSHQYTHAHRQRSEAAFAPAKTGQQKGPGDGFPGAPGISSAKEMVQAKKIVVSLDNNVRGTPAGGGWYVHMRVF
jgi:hypothetical protein